MPMLLARHGHATQRCVVTASIVLLKKTAKLGIVRMPL